MAPTRKETIQKKALELVEGSRKGVRYSELMTRLAEAFPQIPKNTIAGSVWNHDAIFPTQVYKPARGVFQSKKFEEPATAESEAAETPHPPSPEVVLKEEQFYEPFADWITSELEECT